jgi:acetoin utilization deacetylase AcuC-like enzyme
MVHAGWDPITRAQLLTAHHEEYVDAFLRGDPLCESNGISWSPGFLKSVLHANGSLLSATVWANQHPEVVQMSPTSGFHHATPDGGGGFCTFSGQVISALHMWRTQKRRCAWIDLDGHFGNSIEDSREFAPDLNEAIPRGCNLNPTGTHQRYLNDLAEMLLELGEDVIAGRIHYVCVAHGADSHEWDQLGGQTTTAEWIDASRMVYASIRQWSAAIGRPVPVVISLFGGYRDDHPDSVLALHTKDLAVALEELGGVPDSFVPDVRP